MFLPLVLRRSHSHLAECHLDRRVEIMFPVLREELKDRIRKYMELELEDNLKAHVLQPDGTYEKPDRRGKLPVGSQMASQPLLTNSR